MNKTAMKLRNSPEFESAVITFLKSDEFSKMIDSIVKTRVSEMQNEINRLEMEIKNIRQSNIDLVSLLTNKSEKTHEPIREEHSNVFDNFDDTQYSVKTIFPNTLTKDVKSDRQQNRKSNEQKSVSLRKHTKSFKNKKSIIVGAAIQDDTESLGTSEDVLFEGDERKIWLYVDRCKSEVGAEHIRKYLLRKCPGENFVIEPLRKTGNPSFKVGVPYHLEEQVYAASFWPKDIIVKPFRFFRFNEQYRQRHHTKNPQYRRY